MSDGVEILERALSLAEIGKNRHIVSIGIHPHTITEWRGIMRAAEAFKDNGVCIERYWVSGTDTFVTYLYVSPKNAGKVWESDVTLHDPTTIYSK